MSLLEEIRKQMKTLRRAEEGEETISLEFVADHVGVPSEEAEKWLNSLNIDPTSIARKDLDYITECIEISKLRGIDVNVPFDISTMCLNNVVMTKDGDCWKGQVIEFELPPDPNHPNDPESLAESKEFMRKFWAKRSEERPPGSGIYLTSK